jgi:DNA-binding NtrC family response regulator
VEVAVLHPDDALEPPAVLIVDDDESIVVAASRTLRPSQLTVLATTDIDQAQEWLHTRDIAVMVTDFQMPRMNGLELISIARAAQPSTVRILMTGQNALETAIEAINRGEIFRYVPKPFDGAKFRAVVTDALTRHRELALALAERDEVIRRDRYFESVEHAHPGICAVERDDEGCYIVPEVCNAIAVRMLGFDGRTA